MDLIHRTIAVCLEERKFKTPDQVAMCYEDFSYTWREIDLLSDYMAVRMNLYGVKRGEHAGIWCVNNPNWVITYFALVKLGAVPVLINTCYREQELAAVIRYADIQYLYYGDAYKEHIYSEIIGNIRGQFENQVKKWIPIGKNSAGRWFQEGSFVSAEKKQTLLNNISRLKQQVNPEDVTSILFTSGTTSASKGVMLTHENLLNAANATVQSMKWGQTDKICVAVPLFHCFGLTSCLLSSLLAGCTICLLPFYRTIDVLNSIKKQRCTVLNGVPTMFLAMLRNPEFNADDLSSLKTGIIAGSPLSGDEYLSVCKAIPNLKLQPSYGQTETSPAVTFADLDDSVYKKAESVGKAVPKVSVRIAGVKDGMPVEPGKIGEIQVKGYNVMKGYYRLQEETREALEPSGWLHTGDLGQLDQDGYLYVTGRVKEMIIRAGENIAPKEIEDILKQFPDVEQVKVLGIPAPVIQEEIIACVILAPDAAFNEKEIQNYMMTRLAYYKVPSKILQFEEFPVSATGKILIPELRNRVLDKLHQMKNEEI